MKMKEHTKILPCPKCGAKGEFFDYCGDGGVCCTNKNCRHMGAVHNLWNVWADHEWEGIENAILDWNADR